MLLLSGQNNHDWNGHHPGARGHPRREREVRGRRSPRPPEALTAESLERYDVIVSNWNAFGVDAGSCGLVAGDPRGVSRLREAGQGSRRGPRGQLLVRRLGGLPAAHPRDLEDGPDEPRAQSRVPGPDRRRRSPRDRGPRGVHHHRRALEPARLAEGVEVLASSFSAADEEGTGRWEPSVLAGRFGQGRSLTILLGHDVRAMGTPGFRALLRRAVEWAATGDVAPRTWRWRTRGRRPRPRRPLRTAVAVPLRPGPRRRLLPPAEHRRRARPDLGPAAPTTSGTTGCGSAGSSSTTSTTGRSTPTRAARPAGPPGPTSGSRPPTT